MGVLQKCFERLIDELLAVESILAVMLRKVAKERSLNLSDNKIRKLARSLAKAIGKSDGDTVRVTVTLEGDSPDVTIDSEELTAALKDFKKGFEDGCEKAVMSALDKVPPDVLKSLYADASKALRHERKIGKNFRTRLSERWHEGIDRLEMLILIAREAGASHIADIQEQNSEREASTEDYNCTLSALCGLHVRACRIASEVLCLLGGGFADGANARWRSLHEIAITAMFLFQHQGDTARRYLDHSAIDRRRAAQQYQMHCKVLGHKPLSKKEMASIELEATAAIQSYEDSFKYEYGWAAKALGISKPTFVQIEESLDMAHWRPYYKMACDSIHAGSQALNYSISIPSGAESPLLAGASDAGLSDPGHSTAISLMQASVALLTFQPNLDGLITCRCMQQLCEDIGHALLAADQQKPVRKPKRPARIAGSPRRRPRRGAQTSTYPSTSP